ncbi:unnamed protein product [Adineta steineri]|uniref:Uncharacterized protein n=1 Tax=Adineta steineri TaxID=433720 RepID=A0A815FH55_9BILA|nr:unnamed protein product [Adineta steineri]CAF1328577.1 unnamed protein product [Adineta steineri]CAF3640017.1 unnamed protein product [Adineta steineri]CAF3885927.1 unnamed protein product [Adineta steineri]
MVARIGAIIKAFSNDNSIYLPVLLHGSVSFIASMFALMFSEILNQSLLQSAADVAQMNRRTSRTKQFVNHDNELKDYSPNLYINNIKLPVDNDPDRYIRQEIKRF